MENTITVRAFAMNAVIALWDEPASDEAIPHHLVVDNGLNVLWNTR
jgi:hypothetical protein